MPVEKHRDETARLVILRSAAPFCLSDESMQKIMEAEPEKRTAFLTGLAGNAQPVFRYTLYGYTVNFMSEKVLTPHDIHPSDDIKQHLGLTGENAKNFFWTCKPFFALYSLLQLFQLFY